MHSEVRHFGTVRCGIHFWLMWYKNYWNQSRFAKVVAKSLQPYFYGWQCMSVGVYLSGAVKVWDPRQKNDPVAVMEPADGDDRRDCWAVAFGKYSLSLCWPVCLTACLPACLSVCLVVCLSACLSVCLPAWLSVCFYYHVHISREARFKRCIFMSNLKVVSTETSCSVVLIILFPMQHFINIC